MTILKYQFNNLLGAETISTMLKFYFTIFKSYVF